MQVTVYSYVHHTRLREKVELPTKILLLFQLLLAVICFSMYICSDIKFDHIVIVISLTIFLSYIL